MGRVEGKAALITGGARGLGDARGLGEAPGRLVAREGETVVLTDVLEPMDIAWNVLHLASVESPWVTGPELVIDDGITAA